MKREREMFTFRRAQGGPLIWGVHPFLCWLLAPVWLCLSFCTDVRLCLAGWCHSIHQSREWWTLITASGCSLGIFRSFRGLPLTLFKLMFLQVIAVPRVSWKSHEWSSAPVCFSFRLTKSVGFAFSCRDKCCAARNVHPPMADCLVPRAPRGQQMQELLNLAGCWSQRPVCCLGQVSAEQGQRVHTGLGASPFNATLSRKHPRAKSHSQSKSRWRPTWQPVPGAHSSSHVGWHFSL